MKTITIVTGNPGKVRELKSMAMGKINFVMRDVELTEIQSLDLLEIINDKLLRAYEIIKKPVIVDDVSAGLASMNGLPGPFIKYFNQQLGDDALLKLSRHENEIVTVTCMAGYFDGKHKIIAEGTFIGKVVKRQGKNGFGFDSVVIPDGQTRTMAEMPETEKMKVSHRGKAFRSLLEQIEQLIANSKL